MVFAPLVFTICGGAIWALRRRSLSLNNYPSLRGLGIWVNISRKNPIDFRSLILSFESLLSTQFSFSYSTS